MAVGAYSIDQPRPDLGKGLVRSPEEATEARRRRGLVLAALCAITQKNGQWIVPSQTGNGTSRVNLNPSNPAVPLCTCDDFAKRGQKCKHVFAVEFVLSREQGDTPLDPVEVETAAPSYRRPPTVAPRPTYKQDWPAYDRAQTTEKRHFQALLADLCSGIPEPARKPGRGRKPIPLSDRIFAAVFQVFSTVSARRFLCDLSDASARGYIAKVPHFTSIADTLALTTLTPLLKVLIAESAKPLRAIETEFVVDPSGFATSRFVRWFDHQYGRPRQEYDWVKCHVLTGVKTHVVTAVEMEGRYAADSPQFQPLLQATAQNFAVREVSADSAYLSSENADAVAALGGTPYILPKSNTTGGKGGILEKMLHLYSFKREEFLAHYHKRSNGESTFSMVKAKFGDALRSRTDTAMVNEALCKILCHNICCLIQSLQELGIVATFWADEEIEATAVPTGPGPDIDQMFSMFEWI